MYESTLVAGSNFENLFATYDVASQDTTTPPLANSLFNASTMQQFLELGMSTQNIATNNSLVYGDNFILSDSWLIMASQLGLQTGQQAYLLYLWLATAYDITYARSTTTGSFGTGNSMIGQLTMKGAMQFENSMTTMFLEFPAFTFATALAQQFVSSGLSCNDWYTNNLGWETDKINLLCGDSKNIFNWKNNAN